jgi:hypothetical protein
MHSLAWTRLNTEYFMVRDAEIVRLRGVFLLYDPALRNHVEAPVSRAILRKDSLAIDLSLDGSSCDVQLVPTASVAYQGPWEVPSSGRHGRLKIIKFDETSLSTGHTGYAVSGFWTEGQDERFLIGVLRRVPGFGDETADE